jgi:hypothetical protein
MVRDRVKCAAININLKAHTILNQKIKPYLWKREDEIEEDLKIEEGMPNNF